MRESECRQRNSRVMSNDVGLATTRVDFAVSNQKARDEGADPGIGLLGILQSLDDADDISARNWPWDYFSHDQSRSRAYANLQEQLTILTVSKGLMDCSTQSKC
jgi:hypothetical protein